MIEASGCWNRKNVCGISKSVNFLIQKSPTIYHLPENLSAEVIMPSVL